MLTNNDFQKIKLIVDESVEQKLKPVHKKLNTMQKSLDTTINYFDTVTTKHTRRIKRLEDHLEFQPIPEFA